jgi:CheY-like chemotaxis protein
MVSPVRAAAAKMPHDEAHPCRRGSADLRGVLGDLLTGSGYNVVEATDGQEGVAKAKSERPDPILMVIQLPVIDGYEATRQIKAEPIKTDEG